MFIRLLSLIIVAWVLFTLWPTPSVNYGPGVIAGENPTQRAINKPQPFDFKGYQITPLANFAIKAKILGKENYRFDREADLAPVDLALGWGKMSDESVLEYINIRQSNRWYYWRTDRWIITRKEIETSSANMHMIPATPDVEQQLNSAREGQLIVLQGKLVSVQGKDGWRWKSSLTRNDTGNGACELIYVESVQLN